MEATRGLRTPAVVDGVCSLQLRGPGRGTGEAYGDGGQLRIRARLDGDRWTVREQQNGTGTVPFFALVMGVDAAGGNTGMVIQ